MVIDILKCAIDVEDVVVVLTKFSVISIRVFCEEITNYLLISWRELLFIGNAVS